MAYSLSKNIQIFPVTQRNIWDPLGRLTTEYNLTSILNKLLDVDGFVFTENDTVTEGGFTKKNPLDISEDSTVLDFNLNGYIIHLKDLNNLIASVLGGKSPSDGTSIYAYIELAKKTSAPDEDILVAYEKEHFKYLNGQDIASRDNDASVTKDASDSTFDSDSNAYRGVIFTSAKPTQPLHLKILEYHTSTNSIEYKDKGWYIPKESQIKFQSNLKRTSISIDDGVI